MATEQRSPADYASAVAGALESDGWRLDATHVTGTTYLLGGTHADSGETAVVIVAASPEERLDRDHLVYLLRARERYDTDRMLAHARGGVPGDVIDYCADHGIDLRRPENMDLAGGGDDDSRRTRRTMLLVGLLGLGTSGVLLWDRLGSESDPPSAGGGVATPDDDSGSQTLSLDGGLTELWTADLGSSIARPAVGDGRVYAGVAAESLVALDGGTGEQLWRVRIPNGASSPAVVDSTVYVGGVDEQIYAVDADRGDVRWTLGVENVVRDVTVADDTVYAPVPSPFGVATEADPHRLYAVDAATGETSWVFETTTRGGEFQAPVQVADGTVYAASRAGTLSALDAASGDAQWTYDVGATATFGGLLRPAATEGAVYLALDDGRRNDATGKLFAVDAATGETAWTTLIEGRAGAPALNGGTVAVPVGSRLRGYEASTGDEQWTYGAEEPFLAHATAVGDTLLVNGSTTLYGVASGSGEERLRYGMASGLSARPTVGADRLYVGRNDGTLSAFVES